MDGDSTAKTLDFGANSALRNTEGSDSIHEASHQAVCSNPISFIRAHRLTHETQEPAGQKTQGTGTPAFSKDGAIGSMFKADGAIGGTAEKVGGPFARDGAVGSVVHLFVSSFLGRS